MKLRMFRERKPGAGGIISFYTILKSFRYALAGTRQFILSERNAFIHLAATLTSVSLAIALKVTTTEVMAITIVTGFVWSAELFNTAVEKMTDFICPERNISIKFIKDVSAGAVLVAAITALATGCIIFIPKIIVLCK